MYEVVFYRDKNGVSEISDLLDQLQMKAETNKTARINRQKILSYMKALSEYGTRLGMPFVEHIEGDIWQLRPLKHRMFFFYWTDNKFVILHHFEKKTRKTPRREIDIAIAHMNDHLEREGRL